MDKPVYVEGTFLSVKYGETLICHSKWSGKPVCDNIGTSFITNDMEDLQKWFLYDFDIGQKKNWIQLLLSLLLLLILLLIILIYFFCSFIVFYI